MESDIGMGLEWNGTIALAFGLKPALCSDYISHGPLRSHALLPTYCTFNFVRVYNINNYNTYYKLHYALQVYVWTFYQED